MSTNAISGKDGTCKIGATEISEITKWDFKPQAKNVSYISNKTGGYEATVAGPLSGKGNMTGVWDPAIPPTGVINPGTAVTLLLYINATQFYSVPAVIDQMGPSSVDRAGNIVEWSASFTANGAWTNPIASGSITIPEDPQFVPGKLWEVGSEDQAVEEIAKLGKGYMDNLLSEWKASKQLVA